ncbi:MAG: alpha-galactosidase [Candidatus Hodarchaeota archaeon]
MAGDASITVESTTSAILFSNEHNTIELHPEDLVFSIKDKEKNEYIIQNSGFGCEIRYLDGSGKDDIRHLTNSDFTYGYHELRDSTIPSSEKGKSAWFFIESREKNLTGWLVFDLQEDSTCCIIKLVLQNKTTHPLSVVSLSPLSAALGIFQESPINPKEVKVFCNGYQSWTPSKTLGLNEKQMQVPINLLQRVFNYNLMPFWKWLRRPRGMLKSSGVTVITHESSKKSITIGFLDFSASHGEIMVQIKKSKKNEIAIQARSAFDGKKLRPDGELSSPDLYIQHQNNYPRCLDEYAVLVGQYMQPVFWKIVPFGYCTWYYYFSNITESETLKNLGIIMDGTKNPFYKIDYYQLDDGYQFTHGQCGDWKKTNPEKFPHGLKHVASEIEKKGLVPGLWVAPFNAAINSDLAKDHPDWLLCNVKGKAIKPTLISGSWQYALDLTNPEVLDYLKDLFKFIVKESGFKYIKIDFVFSAITEDAVLSNPDFTRVEAYREALKVLREEAGKDVFILGCGAPIMESVGFVNGMRISTDTTPKWETLSGILERLNLELPGMKNAMLNTITRSWMHKKFWINDPDCLLVRTERSKLTIDEIRTQISIMGLSGGQIAISEDLELLDRDAMRLISLLQPIYPEPAHSPDMFVNKIPQLYLSEGTSTTHSEWKVVTLINWNKKSRDMKLNLKEICSTAETYHLIDFWEKKHLGTFLGDEIISFSRVPGHGCKLLRLTKESKSELLLLGTTFHVLQGSLEVEEFHLDESKDIITLKLVKFGKNEGNLYLRLPPRYLFEVQEGEHYKIDEISEGIYKIFLKFKDKLELELKLEIA